MLFLQNGLKVEYVSVTLADNTGLALPVTFGSKNIVGVCIVEQAEMAVNVDDLKVANSSGTVTVTANFAGNVTKVCKLAIIYRG